MFTGIIQDLGIVTVLTQNSDTMRLAVQSPKLMKDSVRGESIAVNGTCLTVNDIMGDTFVADVMAETIRTTSLAKLKINDKVNLERALTPSSFMGGHFVQGHVDATGVVETIENHGQYWILKVRAEKIFYFLVTKGSIAINGISLTLLEVANNSFSVSIIPTTFIDTNIQYLKIGDEVNLEVDMMAKYVYHYLRVLKEEKVPITEEFLRNHGF